ADDADHGGVVFAAERVVRKSKSADSGRHIDACRESSDPIAGDHRIRRAADIDPDIGGAEEVADEIVVGNDDRAGPGRADVDPATDALQDPAENLVVRGPPALARNRG